MDAWFECLSSGVAADSRNRRHTNSQSEVPSLVRGIGRQP
jgi:hypothetical protein